jgi:hypothetical protein
MATQNTIIQLLNEAGYKNQGTNRERAIRNLNLLLDAGVLSIKFCHADKYNDSNSNWAFWYDSKDGKRRCTAYQVTLFGRTFNGDFVAKTRSERTFFGDKYVINIDNSSLDINQIMIRVAKLISILKGKGDFLAPSEFGKYGDCSCGKCSGRGIIPQFMHYAEGVCFDCGGTGIQRGVLKSYIAESIKLATK